MWFNFPYDFHLTEKEHWVSSELWIDCWGRWPHASRHSRCFSKPQPLLTTSRSRELGYKLGSLVSCLNSWLHFPDRHLQFLCGYQMERTWIELITSLLQKVQRNKRDFPMLCAESTSRSWWVCSLSWNICYENNSPAPPQLEPQSTPEPGKGAGMKLRILAKTKARKYTLKRIARKA